MDDKETPVKPAPRLWGFREPPRRRGFDWKDHPGLGMEGGYRSDLSDEEFQEVLRNLVKGGDEV